MTRKKKKLKNGKKKLQNQINPYQLDVGSGGTKDESAIHLTREGIPTGVISRLQDTSTHLYLS